MPKLGQMLPFKTVFQYPGQQARTIPCHTMGDAEREAGDIARRGGRAVVYHQAERGDIKSRVQLSSFGPDVQHAITVIGDRYLCTCGSKGSRTPYERMPGDDHAQSARPADADED
jgi:hypothetical protein